MSSIKSYNPIEEVLASVKTSLRSFDESGLLDDSEMIFHIIEILHKYKLSRDYNKKIVLDVFDGFADIPEDIDPDAGRELTLCEVFGEDANVTRRYYFGRKPEVIIQKDYSKRLCYHKCEIHDETEWIVRTLYFDSVEPATHKFTRKKKIEYKPDFKPGILSEDFDKGTLPTYYRIGGKKFEFNFKEGHVLLDYTGLVLDDDGYPLIEDNPYIKRALIDYLIYRSLEVIFYNSEADVIGRLQYAKQMSDRSCKDLDVYKKMPTRESMLKFADRVRKSSNGLNYRY